MSEIKAQLTSGTKSALVAGIVLVLAGFGSRSWLLGLAGLGILIGVGRILIVTESRVREPWPWPPDFRAWAEGMARPIDPTPKRLLPPDEKAKAAMIAQVATTKEALARLIADKPNAWPWAVFASVLLQRRNAVQSRLRVVTSGYQPRPGTPPLTGQAYSHTARGALTAITDLLAQLGPFILSPAFKGAFGDVGRESSADADAIVAVANRLMDYHEAFLSQAESCFQTRVQSEVLVFVTDMGALALAPLVGYEKFIATMCARIGEAQDLLPYTKGDTVVQLDDVSLEITLPEGLSDRVVAHIKEFNK